MQIKEFLFVISLLGIAQGALITAMILVRSGKRPNRAWLLSGLFLASILVMMLVTSVNSGLVIEKRWMTVTEIFITLAIGPMLYWYIRLQQFKKSIQPIKVGLHFLPAILWLGIALTNLGTGTILAELPFFVFIAHFQLYVLVGAVSYLYKKPPKDTGKQQQWLGLLLLFFLLQCVGQWLRFAFSHWEALQLIVPSAAACSFYLITIIALQRSSLWPAMVKHHKKIQTFDIDNGRCQRQALEQIMEKEERYRDPHLNRNKLALALDMSPNQLTRLIQLSYGIGFTEYVNQWRLEKVKVLLLDPDHQPLTLEAIGQEAGFQSRSAFYRIFKAATGQTPAIYRKEHS